MSKRDYNRLPVNQRSISEFMKSTRPTRQRIKKLQIQDDEVDIINIYGDGRCLFRCMAVHLFGRFARDEDEKQCADLLRAQVVTFLGSENNKSSLTQIAMRLPMLLDNTLAVLYASIGDRLEKMRKPGEYGGYLEIAGLSFIFKVPIEFYELQGSELKLHTRIPSDGFKKQEPVRTVRIVYSPDRLGHPGHFDLLCKNIAEHLPRHGDSPSTLNALTTFGENYASKADSDDQALQFHEFLDPSKQYADCAINFRDAISSVDHVDEVSKEISEELLTPKLRDDYAYNCDEIISGDGNQLPSAHEIGQSDEIEVEDSVNPDTNSDETLRPYSIVWTEVQWLEHKAKHDWLDCRDGRLGCKACSSIDGSGLGPNVFSGCKLSAEWTSYEISFNGSDRKQRLKSLRSKISAHHLSVVHKKATDILAQQKQECLKQVITSQNVKYNEETKRIFNTAYYLAKSDRPYSDHLNLVSLQQKNGVDVGLTLHSRYSCTEIIDHLASEFRKKLFTSIITNQRKISLLLDESTTLSKLSTLIVYMRTVITESEDTIFVGLVELNDQKAETIFRALSDLLSSYGFTDSYLIDNLVCVASDGASVMLGNKSGVCTLLMARFPNILIWHCLNHRIELAISDSIDDISAVNHFHMFIDTVYALFSQSPKNSRELEEVTSKLETQLTKIGRILDVRWVASSFRTVKSVWNSYPALITYFQQASADPSRKGTERAKFSGLVKQMQAREFLCNLALLYDTLNELSYLSLQLQERACTIPRADKLIHRTINVIRAMKIKPGVNVTECDAACEAGKFKGITLTTNVRIQVINRQQFLTSLIDNLYNRCCTTISTRTASSDAAIQYQEEYRLLIKHIEILEPASWPNEIDINFGQIEIDALCQRFKLKNRRSIKNGFRDFVDNGGRKCPEQLKSLVQCVNTLPCSTADCERGFSAMNAIITNSRSRLLVKHVSNLMFVKLNGPPLQQWDSERYVRSWLLNHRAAADTQARRVAADVDTENKEIWSLF